jgi:type II secretory pathway component PulK
VRSDININFAPPEVLMALGPGIDRATADMLVSAREAQPFPAVDDFRAFPLLLGRPLLSDGLATASRWFALRMHASVGASEFAARTLLARAAPEQIMVIDRQRGFFDE